jgi:MFS family permease
VEILFGKALYDLWMIERLRRLNPFQTPEAQRLAVLFAVVYFAQGMYGLPDQTITIAFKDQGLKADQVATFFLLASIPWFIKPVYGLVSDFVPLFGRRRKSYMLLSASLACLMGLVAGLSTEHTYWRLAALYTAMGFGLAFTDVLADALMVENGKPRGLTGASRCSGHRSRAHRFWWASSAGIWRSTGICMPLLSSPPDSR